MLVNVLLIGSVLEPSKDCQKLVYFAMSRFIFSIFSYLSGTLAPALVGTYN